MQSAVRGRSEDMLTRRGRDTGTNDLDGTEQPYNPVREDGSVFLPFLLPSAASRNPGAGTVFLPVGGVEGEAEPPPADLPQKKIFEEIRQITTYKIVP